MGYEKPIILDENDIGEGIFTASGNIGSCYTVSAYIHQIPETGRGDYRIQVDAHHNADHTKTTQYLTISFNQNVIFKSSQGSVLSGSGTNTLKIHLSYYQNPTDNIGFGDLVVESDPGLAITGVFMTD